MTQNESSINASSRHIVRISSLPGLPDLLAVCTPLILGFIFALIFPQYHKQISLCAVLCGVSIAFFDAAVRSSHVNLKLLITYFLVAYLVQTRNVKQLFHNVAILVGTIVIVILGKLVRVSLIRKGLIIPEPEITSDRPRTARPSNSEEESARAERLSRIIVLGALALPFAIAVPLLLARYIGEVVLISSVCIVWYALIGYTVGWTTTPYSISKGRIVFGWIYSNLSFYCLQILINEKLISKPAKYIVAAIITILIISALPAIAAHLAAVNYRKERKAIYNWRLLIWLIAIFALICVLQYFKGQLFIFH